MRNSYFLWTKALGPKFDAPKGLKRPPCRFPQQHKFLTTIHI